jgi:hypothetical protein
MQHLKEDAKEALKKATHPLNKEKKAEDHAQAEAAKAQASLKKEEQHMQSVGGRQGSDPEARGPSIAGERPDRGQHSPTNDPLLAAEDYQPSSLDESSGGVKGALKTAVNKMTPGDGVAGPNSAIGDGATGGSGFGYGGNLA